MLDLDGLAIALQGFYPVTTATGDPPPSYSGAILPSQEKFSERKWGRINREKTLGEITTKQRQQRSYVEVRNIAPAAPVVLSAYATIIISRAQARQSAAGIALATARSSVLMVDTSQQRQLARAP